MDIIKSLGLKDVFDTSSKVALLLGSLLILLGAAGGVPAYVPVTQMWAQIALIVAGIFIILAGLLKNEASRELTPSDIAKLGIKIRSPRANDRIERIVRVVVESSKALPKGYELYVLRGYPRENGVVPNAKAQKTINLLEWTVEEFDIAGVKDDVRRIEVWLVGANGRVLLDNWQANHKVLAAANRKLEDLGQKTGWLPSIQTRTSDMHLCEAIAVTKGS